MYSMSDYTLKKYEVLFVFHLRIYNQQKGRFHRKKIQSFIKCQV